MENSKNEELVSWANIKRLVDNPNFKKAWDQAYKAIDDIKEKYGDAAFGAAISDLPDEYIPKPSTKITLESIEPIDPEKFINIVNAKPNYDKLKDVINSFDILYLFSEDELHVKSCDNLVKFDERKHTERLDTALYNPRGELLGSVENLTFDGIEQSISSLKSVLELNNMNTHFVDELNNISNSRSR